MSIFGRDYRKVKNYGPVKRERCNNCCNESTFQLQKLSTWFTLFSIPIIPYRTNYLLVCPICKNYEEIDSSEFLDYVDLIQSQKESENQLLSSDGYITESGAIYRTETQLNFIRQMKEIEMEREKRNSSNE
ncbi:zinc-ribbon domain-containing protein [Acetivibrio cellulolyticus]|uniref:zinc-ribbon domain-containing protein n=1 Tax=Acetivibrio cellulolyticus TaxID=35830 RepID=UPI0001E2FB1D|nr:zinc-ribbon domain-containing protein [Acetivibrio cellulolyticus]